MNRFEDAVHNARRQTGELDTERISELWMSTQRAMFGSSVTLLDHYRTWWSYIPHFVHSPGYVYAYAYGELLVLALYRKYMEEGPPFVALYLDYLESGGRDRPDELLRPFGVDLKDPRFWLQGLIVLEELLREAESELQASGI
jgi:oligoendopeptidase F